MEKQSRPIALSRSVVLTEESSIPSLLLLGKLVSDGFPAASASLLPDKLREIWDPSGTVNFWPVTDGTFLVQFYEAEDLTMAHDGAPWSCGDGDEGLFFMQHVKQGMNMVDQIAGFTKAELWVRFHRVPVDHFSATSVYALAAGIGEPVNCDLRHTSSADFLRARIRVDITRPLQSSVDVVLENGNQESVSVEYEGVLPSLCSSCRILGHPADRCPHSRRAHQPAAAAATAAASRPAVYTPTPSHLGPGRSTSSSLRGKSSRRYEVVFANAPTSPAPPPTPPTPSALRRSGQEPLSPVNSSCFNFFKLKSWRKGVGKNKSFSTVDDSQHEIEPSNQETQVLETNSPMERVQVPSVMETHETQLDTTPITHSYFIVKAQGSRSRNHARIEIMVETHCSPQFIMGAMQWLSKKDVITGLDAAYDGKRGVISIYGLQIDQNTDPVDLVAYLLPKIRTKSGLAETQTKPDSPARFADTMMRFHDANCCKVWYIIKCPGEPSTSPDVGNQFLDSPPRGDGVRAKPPTSRSTSSGDRTKPSDSRALRLGGSPSPSAEIYSTELYSASVEAPLPSGNGDGGLPAERRRPPLLRRTGSPQITEPSASTCSGTASTYSGNSGPAAAHARRGATQRIHLV